jgi:hypothetical protein
MGERRGHPVAAFLIVLVTVPGSAAAAVFAVLFFSYGQRHLGVWLAVAALVALVGGLWLARWFRTGRWSLRRRVSDEPSAPGARVTGDGKGEVPTGGEARGHPVAAAVITVVTLFFTFALTLSGVTTFSGYAGSYEFGGAWSEPPRHAVGLVVLFAATAVFVAGLWVTWRVGSGRWGLRRRPTAPEPPVPGGGDREGGS